MRGPGKQLGKAAGTNGHLISSHDRPIKRTVRSGPLVGTRMLGASRIKEEYSAGIARTMRLTGEEKERGTKMDLRTAHTPL